MSYWLQMRFAKAETIDEALKIAFLAKKNVTEKDIEKALVNNVVYFGDDYSKGKPLSFYLDHVLKLNFAYFSEKKLLALYSCNVDFDYNTVGFGECIEFQNSCDQDYSYKTWDAMHGVCDDLVENCKNMNAEDLKIEDDNYKEYYSEEELNEDLEYYRKSYLYEQIFKGFGIEDFLYERKNSTAEIFSFSLINMQNQRFNYETIAKKILIIRDNYFEDDEIYKKYKYFEDYYDFAINNKTHYENIVNLYFDRAKEKRKNGK